MSFLALLVTIAIVDKACCSSVYDGHCEEIESKAKLAGYLYNRGRQQEAFAALDGARQSFREARRLDPSAPTAYVSLATSLLNSNHLDEASVLWRGAQKRVSDLHQRSWIDGQLRWTQYGKISMQRDKIYAHGQGNLSRALNLMGKQIAIYPTNPKLHHDKATVHIMMSAERGAGAVKNATEAFAAAQQAAMRAWSAGLTLRKRSNDPTCDPEHPDFNARVGEAKHLVYDWPAWHVEAAGTNKSALVDLQPVGMPDSLAYGPEGCFKDTGGYIAKFQDVGISGDDGVIVDEARCTIFVPSAGTFVDLSTNLQMLELWKGPPTPYANSPRFSWFDVHRGRAPQHGQIANPQKVKKAASIVHFAGPSHFHSLTEVIGRLCLLVQGDVLEDKDVILIVPAGPKKGFLANAVHILAPEILESQRVIFWTNKPPKGVPDVRVRAKVLYFADWRPPAAFGEDGGHCATPRSVLLRVRSAFLGRFKQPSSGKKTKSQALIFALRKGSDMRSRLEGEAMLKKELKKVSKLAQPKLAYEEFDGSALPAPTVTLFNRARLVLGVHGGALANILFCPLDAELFELGFATPFGGHYRHLAAAIGMKTTLLPLQIDERGMGVIDVRVANISSIVASVSDAVVGRESELREGTVSMEL